MIQSYSQYQEDLILDAIFSKENGFYVDVGAYDPIKFSNTCRLYNKGWNGVNIEPQIDRYKKFEKVRTRDINLNLGVGKESGFLSFYILGSQTLSSFDRKTAERNSKRFGVEITEVVSIKVDSLKNILSKTVQLGQEIDFISIDTEGYELEVVGGNDWDIFRPCVVLIEVGENIKPIVELFEDREYSLVYKNSCNYFFKNSRSLKR